MTLLADGFPKGRLQAARIDDVERIRAVHVALARPVAAFASDGMAAHHRRLKRINGTFPEKSLIGVAVKAVAADRPTFHVLNGKAE